MGKKKCPECEECLPAWLAAFGDLMSLLLCFFVLLLSMSSMDAKKISEAIGSLAGAMSVLEGGTKTEISKQRIQESTPIESQSETSEMVNRIAQAIVDANEMVERGHGPAVSLEEAENGFVIKLPASLLFKSGTAKVYNDDALLFLKRIALIIDNLPQNIEVEVGGHSDNLQPSKSSLYKDNWGLSGARAISVLKELILDGVDAKRIHASSYAEFKPISTNATKEGREKNRRVELRFFGTEDKDQGAIKKSILDNAN